MSLLLKVTNVTATFNLNCRINLLELAKCIKSVEYKPKKKNSATYRSQNPRFTALIHATGKVILVGINNEINVKIAADMIIVKLQKHMYPVSAAGDLEFRINLSRLNDKIKEKVHCDYNPELFPGMICTFNGTNCKATFYTS
ncbi:hypothetical protein B4U80_14824, partial [Leptotrombidium deliense]